MSDQKFADTHNLVVFLEKPTESEGFKEIVDFLNAHPIKYALTVNPTIYSDKKKVIITESSIKRDLLLEDANGVDCLLNAAIFEKLALMGRKQRKDTEVSQPSGPTEPMADETKNVASVPTHSNDPLLSEKTKTSQAAEITELKERVKKLEKKEGSRTHSLKRLYKVGRSARVVSSKYEGLGDQEDASKQGRKIDEIDQDAKVTLVDEMQG
ncbi:hypothetical protein Tco_1463277, partial [Tanacetum coccineum]